MDEAQQCRANIAALVEKMAAIARRKGSYPARLQGRPSCPLDGTPYKWDAATRILECPNGSVAGDPHLIALDGSTMSDWRKTLPLAQ